jgi:uncharacterized protein
VLRGAALLGVFVENAQHFFAPTYRAQLALPGAGFVDDASVWLIQVLLENKVYTLFSLLFGLGVALQIAKSGERFGALHARRMGVLLAIGILHQAYLWSGDILATYALLGFLLAALRGQPRARLERIAALALATPTLLLAAVTAASAGHATQRVALAAVEWGYPLRQACFALAMFLLGLAWGRDAAPGRLSLPLRRVGIALGVGLSGSLAHVALVDLSGASIVSWTAVAAEALVAVAGPALALACAALLLRALEHPRARALLAPLAAAGRLSITNYLMQSLIGVLLLSRLGVIRPPVGIAISCAVFAAQVAASRLWLARFQFGPVEWVWRALSYGKPPPLRA